MQLTDWVTIMMHEMDRNFWEASGKWMTMNLLVQYLRKAWQETQLPGAAVSEQEMIELCDSFDKVGYSAYLVLRRFNDTLLEKRCEILEDTILPVDHSYTGKALLDCAPEITAFKWDTESRFKKDLPRGARISGHDILVDETTHQLWRYTIPNLPQCPGT